MQKNNKNAQVEVKSDGYKFAVTFLAAIGSILYTMFNFLQNTPVTETVYSFICLFISLGLVIAAGFLLYLLIKGFSMEVTDDVHVKNLNNIARQIYLNAVVFFSILIFHFISGFFIISYFGFGSVSADIQTI